MVAVTPAPDPARLLARLASQAPRLELSTLDICFLAWLKVRAHQEGLTSFSEQQLIAGFQQVCDAVEPETERTAARATHSIRRLREQRLLARVDGAGVIRPGEFALSRLGAAIVEFHLEEEVLTVESLSLLTRTVQAQLAAILAAAREAATDLTLWQQEVEGPLRVTVGDLVSGIERRQRGLDAHQQEFQAEISSLLAADWFGAIDHCQTLLDSTASTLRELGELLLGNSQPLLALLQELLELATASGADGSLRAAQEVSDQVDRICAWGGTRQAAWSEYYEYVHRYLRDVVRLDPSRALSQRLRTQLTSDRIEKHTLSVVQSPPMLVLRDVIELDAPPPVKRPRAERAPKVEELEQPPDPWELLKERVAAVVQQGVTDLAEITQRLTEEVPAEERFKLAGRIAQVLAELEDRETADERPWVSVSEELAVEQWKISEESEVP